MDGVDVVLSQETRAELQVIIQVERATSFESCAEGRHCRGLGQLSHAFNAPELALSVLSGHLGTPTGTTAVVVIRHLSGRGGTVVMLRVLLLSVEESRHIEVVDLKEKNPTKNVSKVVGSSSSYRIQAPAPE